MKTRKPCKALALILAFLTVFSCVSFAFAADTQVPVADEQTDAVAQTEELQEATDGEAAAAQEQTDEVIEDVTVSSGNRTMAQWNDILNIADYEEYSKKYADIPTGKEEISIEAGNYYSATDTGVKVLENYEGTTGKSIYTSETGTVSWAFKVPSAAMYSIKIEYYPTLAKATNIERMLYINGKVPFSEARTLSMTKVWSSSYETGEDGEFAFKKDIAENDIRPESNQTPAWRTYEVKDSSGYYTDSLKFYFKEGTNTITLEAVREPLVIKSITLYPAHAPMSHEQYLAAHSGEAAGSDIVKIEAEFPQTQSDNAIYPLTDRTSAITSPQDPTAQILNIVGGNENFKTVGQWATYEFEIENAGMYQIVSRFKQADLSGMFTSRTVLIDGEVPFAECYNTRFDYSKDWQADAFTDGESEFEFYLTKGKHTLTIEVSLGELSDVIRQVESSLDTINDCYLEIMKLTGADPDEYRDYGFSRLMPNTIKAMLIESRRLYSISDFLTELCGSKGSQTATLDKVAFLLNRMGSDEDEIAPNLDNLKTYIGTLGTWLNTVRNQPLRFDYFLIQPKGTEMPLAKASIFEAIWFEAQSFFSSFFTDYSTMGAVSEEAVETTAQVWLTEGRDQAKILKSLVSSEFTPTTNIGVNVKLVAAGTLLPSVLSGQGPDVFLGAAGVDVINYAIRNAVYPLNDFEGFDEIASEFSDASLIPVTLYGSTYGLPERASFFMMFVRIDILADLGLEIPKTWDDLLALLPVLQANNMDIGLNREYDLYLYQMGGDRFADDGLRCGLDSTVALEAFEFYTRFYTDYSFPVKFDGPNRFRTGEMPILIADYCTNYNQLTVFATEIEGLWEMVPVPGYEREDENGNMFVDNSAVNAVAAAIMLNGVRDQKSAWTFMKWVCGHSAQAAYGSDLVTTIGPAAKYNTANTLALEEMPWTTDEYNNLITQFNNLNGVSNYPGAYIFARYINFAFLAAYNDGKDAVTEIQSYVNTINKEITRKREEFKLPTFELGQTYESAPEVKAAMEEYLKSLE